MDALEMSETLQIDKGIGYGARYCIVNQSENQVHWAKSPQDYC